MSKIIYVNQLEVEIEYRKVKNINLYVQPPQGRLLVTASRRVPEEKIRQFVERKTEWIVRAQLRVREASGRQEKEECKEITPEQKEALSEKVRFYARKWEPIMGVRAVDWTLREMKTRWGSCTVGTGRIRINTRLVFYPEECLEYVVVHELCHLLEPSHNHIFHSYMTRFLPDWKARKAKLNGC